MKTSTITISCVAFLCLACFGACTAEVVVTGQGNGAENLDGGPGLVALEGGVLPGGGDPNACSGCLEQSVGVGGQLPFDSPGHDSEFVSEDADGALVIDMAHSKLHRHLWVADTNLPGVVKIDLETRQIVGRYVTGGSSTSRTTVNAIGEAFIGAREAGNGLPGVTKILPLGAECPDTNGDGVITTSSGPDQVHAWGQDDCVAWHVETDGDIRGLAAQDIPGVKHAEQCQGFGGEPEEFNPAVVTSDDQHFIWVGGTHGLVYKIDAKTGQVLIKTAAPVQVYGMALAGDGKLWVGAGGGGFGFIDTNACVDQASCDAAPICTQTCTTTSCPATCDSAVKAAYSGMPGGYGITVDYKQRVWRSGFPDAATMRYDPYAPADQRLALSAVGSWGGGIAVDAAGWVWAAHLSGQYVVRVNADTLDGTTIPAPSKGLAVDSLGRVYAIQYEGAVHLIEPGPTLNDNTLTLNAVTLAGIAYAYSDMTGVQTRLASGEPGWYRTIFKPCPDGEAEWRFIKWDVEVPQDTWVMFNVRSAATADELDQALWYTVACIGPPGGTGQASIGAIKDPFLEVEVRFTATADPIQQSVTSARIKSFGVLHTCTKLE